MLKTILGYLSGLVVVGLCVAILRNFDWNFVAAIQWVLGIGITIVNTVADFFQQNEIFKHFVVKR